MEKAPRPTERLLGACLAAGRSVAKLLQQPRIVSADHDPNAPPSMLDVGPGASLRFLGADCRVNNDIERPVTGPALQSLKALLPSSHHLQSWALTSGKPRFQRVEAALKFDGFQRAPQAVRMLANRVA
jgi:hypothetical protein